MGHVDEQCDTKYAFQYIIQDRIITREVPDLKGIEISRFYFYFFFLETLEID